MAMRKRQEAPPPSGSLIVWMAGIVLGAGAGVVLVYHLLLASHGSAAQAFPTRASTAYVKALPAPMGRIAPAAKDELGLEHAQALRDAMKPGAVSN